MAVRGIVGQQVSVAGARTVTARIVAAAGDVLTIAHDQLTHVFPFARPSRRARSDGEYVADAAGTWPHADRARRGRGRPSGCVLDTGADREDLVQQLVALPGIGQWTARYTVIRGLGDPDVFLDTDLGVRRALDRLGLVALGRRAMAAVALVRTAPPLGNPARPTMNEITMNEMTTEPDHGDPALPHDDAVARRRAHARRRQRTRYDRSGSPQKRTRRPSPQLTPTPT